MGGCESVAFATVSMVLWWCSSGMGWDVIYLSHHLEKREYTNSYCCGGSVYWRYCLYGWKCVCGGGCGDGIGYEWEGGGLHCKPILGYVIYFSHFSWFTAVRPICTFMRLCLYGPFFYVRFCAV